ncbi:MAG: hypothetical protein WCF85_06395 [Rhodospirillaceae bacterium]
METVFATHNGCVRNTGTGSPTPQSAAQARHRHEPVVASSAGTPSGLGGQIGELAAALETVGWNHHQVPAAERSPPGENFQHRTPAEGSGSSGLGGQIGELAAALETVGWNHHKVPAAERIPLQEK